MMLLHGEQYLAIKGAIPTSGTLVSEARFSEVLDKGKAAAVTSITTTRNKETGEVVFENQSTVFIRGAGGFGGKKTGMGELLGACFEREKEADIPRLNVQIVDPLLPSTSRLRGSRTMSSRRRPPPRKRPSTASRVITTLFTCVFTPFSSLSLSLDTDAPLFTRRRRSIPNSQRSEALTSPSCTVCASLAFRASTFSASMARSRTSRCALWAASTRARRSLPRCGRRGIRSSLVSRLWAWT